MDRFREGDRDDDYSCKFNCKPVACNGCKLLMPAFIIGREYGKGLCRKCSDVIFEHRVLPLLNLHDISEDACCACKRQEESKNREATIRKYRKFVKGR